MNDNNNNNIGSASASPSDQKDDCLEPKHSVRFSDDDQDDDDVPEPVPVGDRVAETLSIF